MSEPKNPTDAGISRRGFLQTSVAGGVAALAGTTACTPRGQAPAESDAPANPPFELAEKTVPELQEMMESGQYTARAITELYLTRIEAIDRQGPTLRSIIETNPDALEIADELDAERRDNGPRGPLHGIPVILKDNIATADRMTTTAGSLALEGCVPAEDAFVAKKLREAGAILLAKANLSEWANFRSTRSSSGWSARGGQCRNPYALDRNPCGSSSGSGAATSANLGAVSIGTETDGSIVCPSNANGLVGFKPTIGLVSRAGIIPISHHQDSAGPMVRSVVDAAIVMSALTGVDPSDQPTAASDGNTHPDYTTFLDVKGLDGARIGVVRALFGFHSEVDRVMEEALDVMKRQGAEVIDPVELPPRDDFRESEFTVMLFEFKADLNKYLAELGDAAPHRTLAEIIQFNEDNKGREMPYFGQEIFLQAEEKDLSRARSTWMRSPTTTGWPGPRGSMRQSRNTGSPRSSPPPAAPPG